MPVRVKVTGLMMTRHLMTVGVSLLRTQTKNMIEKLSRVLVERKGLSFWVTVIVTAIAAYLSLQLKLYDDPNRWPPKTDPAVELNDSLQRKFGGANLVTIMISRKDGEDIVNPETLALVKNITDQLQEVYGVIPYAVRSLSTINSRYLKGTDGVLDAGLLFEDANRAPETPEELERVRFGIENNAALKGSLVSPDSLAVIVQADFRTGLRDIREGLLLPVTDPISIYRDVGRILEEMVDDVHEVKAAGSPMLIGWVNSDGLPYILAAFLLVVAGIGSVLILAFRSGLGVLPPLVVGVVASTWAFGLQRLVGGEVLTSSAALLAPFIIMAVAASHSVLFIKRFVTDEMVAGRTTEEALKATLIQMTKPLVVVLCTDLMAFVVLSMVPFDNVSVLGQITAFGIVSIMIIVPTLLVAILSFYSKDTIRKVSERAQISRDNETGIIHRVTAVIVRPLIYRSKVQLSVLAGTLIVVLISVTVWFPFPVSEETSPGKFLTQEIQTGQNNTYAVHNYLTKSWEGNDLYEMEREITNRFGGVYTFALIAEGKNPGDVKTPKALVALDNLASHIAENSAVSGVVGLPFYVKIMNRFLNDDNDQHFAIPTTGRAQMAINEALYFLTGGMPGAFDFVVDPLYQNTSMIAFVRDTSPGTVETLIRTTEEYLEKNWDSETVQVEIRLPAGNVGIADAFNRSIKKWMVIATVLSAIASFIAASLLLRSIVGPLLLMFPLAIGILLWAFLIHSLGIEFNSNVTAALAIASGVGIDAEVYLLYRFREEFKKDGDFRRALFQAFTLVREPLVFSFSALFAGCLAVSVVPLYVGYVGFSMALILLTTFLLSLFVAPVVWSMVQPKFLSRGVIVNETP